MQPIKDITGDRQSQSCGGCGTSSGAIITEAVPLCSWRIQFLSAKERCIGRWWCGDYNDESLYCDGSFYRQYGLFLQSMSTFIKVYRSRLDFERGICDESVACDNERRRLASQP